MDIKELLYVLPVFFVPIAIDMAVGAVRGRARYRMNDLLANLTLSLLTVMGSAAVTGATLWIYNSTFQAYALLTLPPGAVWTWALAFLTYDFLYYWAHRAHHRVAWLWAIHVVHHSGEDMNYGLAIRQSAFGETTTWIFFLPMALLGIPPQVYLGIALVQLVFQYFIHNTYVPALGWLEKVLVTPSQHRVHHSRNELYIDKNYGNILVLWDVLFGSYQPEVAEHPPTYGLRTSVRTWNPITLHFHELVELLRKAAACGSPLDAVRCLLKPPAWEPPSLDQERYPGLVDDGPSAQFRKYDPRLARSSSAYCLGQFLALAAGIMLLLWNLEVLSAMVIAVCSGLLLLSAWTLGGLLDGRPEYWRLELARLVTVALFGTAVVWHEALPLTRALLPLVLYTIASTGCLLWFKAGFLEGSSAASGEQRSLAL